MQVQKSTGSDTAPTKLQLTDQEKISHGICPDCENTLQFEEGCKKCRMCGFSAC